MMKRKEIYHFLAIGLCGAVLTGCTTNENSTADTSATESEETQSADTTSSKSSSAASEASSSATSEETNESEESTNSSTDQESQSTSSQESVDVSSELKVNSDNILLPTGFPTDDASSISADIAKNEADSYTVNYTDDQGELAEVSGTLYESSDLAKEEIDIFSNGKSEGPFEEGGKDLGYGITGYGQGAAGSQYFSWEEGNWLLHIHSVTEDRMDHPEIAKRIVEYLEEHTLPAPENQGVVDIQYLLGGEDVKVDIRWQAGNMVYQLKTTRVPLDALEMTVSMK